MIKKARTKFILIGMAATFIVTVLLIVAINLFHGIQEDKNLDRVILEMNSVQGAGRRLAQEGETKGASDTEGLKLQAEKDIKVSEESRGSEADQDIPAGGEFSVDPSGQNIKTGKGQRGSALNQYSGRFFFADADVNGDYKPDRSGMDLLTEKEISDLAAAASGTGEISGFIDGYRYMVFEDTPEKGLNRVCFLDCTTELAARRRVLMISIFVGLGGMAVTFLLIFLASGRIVAPLKESIEKQKQFITDAGHELKTPLSVIGTNMDILSIDLGSNEWVEGTKKQVGKMRDLVNHLISLAKYDESSNVVEFERFNISDAAAEAADLFAGAAKMAGREIESDITEELYVYCNEAMIRQLLTILCDNAVKYAEGKTQVFVRLFKDGRKIVFETANHWNREAAPDDLNRFFDRFYRADASRDRTGGKSGYGLGLSIALAIAQKNHVQLSVHEDKQLRIVMRAVFYEA